MDCGERIIPLIHAPTEEEALVKTLLRKFGGT
jgi:hypothetical protein